MPADRDRPGASLFHGKAEPAASRFRLLLDLYAALEDELAALGPVCAGCGGCCHFETADHILYASALERELISAAALPTAPDAAPEQIARGERCPFQKGGRCLAREARTLGCRLHFCDPDGAGEREELSARWHEKLRALHDSLGAHWDYRRLLPLIRIIVP